VKLGNIKREEGVSPAVQLWASASIIQNLFLILREKTAAETLRKCSPLYLKRERSRERVMSTDVPVALELQTKIWKAGGGEKLLNLGGQT